MRAPRGLAGVGVFAGLAILLLWPAIYNGGPLLDSDTPDYIRYADAAVARITGHPAEWSQIRLVHEAGSASGKNDGDASARSPFLGRSIYYGALLRLGDAYGMMWPSIALQAAALLLAIALTLRQTRGFNLLSFGAQVAILAFTTPVAFFASMLMPDIFAGIVILGAASLLVYGDRMSRAALLAWTGLLCAGVLFHSTHVLIALALLILYLFGRLLFRVSASRAGLAVLTFCVVVGFAGDAAFTLATTRAFGVRPIRPPFLTARLIADGPGADYLKASCPASGFAVCSAADRLPIATATAFLWSTDPAEGGVFTPADAETRRALSDEQLRFVLAVFRYDPFAEIAAMARNTLQQLGKVSMADFRLSSGDRDEFRELLPPRYLQAVQRTRSWRDALPVAVMSAIVTTVLAVSFAYVVWALAFRGRRVAGRDGASPASGRRHYRHLRECLRLWRDVGAVRPLPGTRRVADTLSGWAFVSAELAQQATSHVEFSPPAGANRPGDCNPEAFADRERRCSDYRDGGSSDCRHGSVVGWMRIAAAP
jgi:hypothetical protein